MADLIVQSFPRDSLTVAAFPRPWDFQHVDVTVPAGATCAAIVDACVPDPALRRFAEVLIGDVRVPPDRWTRVRPKPGALVAVNVLPGDGDGLRIGLTVGILAASLAAFAFLPATPVVGALGVNALVGAGIGVAGTLALNFLLPVQPPKITRDTSVDSPTYGFGSSRNAFRPDGPVPQLFGDFRFAAPKAGEYVETLGGKQYIRVLLVLSGGLVTDPEITIGETDAAEYDEVETEFKRGWHPDLLTDQGDWDASSGSFPAGPSFGDRWDVSVGGIVDGVTYAAGDSVIRNWIGDGSTAAGWDQNHDKPHELFPSDVYGEGFNTQLVYNDPIVRTSQADADELAVTISFPALVQYNSKGKKQTASVTFRIEQSPTGAGTWTEVGTFTVRGKKQTAVFWGHRWTVDREDDPAGQFDVRVTRLTVANPTTDNEYLADSFWTRLDTFTNEDPLGETNVGFSTLALRVLATGQLFGTLDQVFCRCQSVERDWTGSAWEWGPTSRPAAHFRHLLQQPIRGDGALADSRVDLARLAEWSEKDAAAGRTFDAYIDFGTTEFAMLEDIAAAGFASYAVRGTKHSVAIDEPKTAPIRLFSPRNTANYKGQIAYPSLPHAIRVAFINADKGWIADEITVYADGHDKTTARVIAEREYLGLTTASANWLRARRDLAEMKLRREIHRVDTSIQSLACERGDLVALQHHAISVGLASGRIRAVA